jgi:hypothetical protein
MSGGFSLRHDSHSLTLISLFLLGTINYDFYFFLLQVIFCDLVMSVDSNPWQVCIPGLLPCLRKGDCHAIKRVIM